MATWSRQTPWRQSHVLTKESSVALGLVSAENVDSTSVVVISHDCDLAQVVEAEPLVEVIVSQRIEKLDGRQCCSDGWRLAIADRHFPMNSRSA
jgi:hypothetical protein